MKNESKTKIAEILAEEYSISKGLARCLVDGIESKVEEALTVRNQIRKERCGECSGK